MMDPYRVAFRLEFDPESGHDFGCEYGTGEPMTTRDTYPYTHHDPAYTDPYTTATKTPRSVTYR